MIGFRAGGSGGATVGLVNIEGRRDFGGRAGVVLLLQEAPSDVPRPEVKEVSGLDFEVTPLITDEPLMPKNEKFGLKMGINLYSSI